ncbi:MAG: hypothetical protein LBR43_03395 [Spiroplasmataceae bacterium]|jgi:predicted  nucleic acid-binding Zn-ribbon protein|nr:hypothetical protein [Spiroplasmataceae bacterium]
MVKNQEEFNEQYKDKEIEEIEIKRKNFQGSLVIEDYPKLEEIYLYNVSSIEKITLKNLPQLKECTIRGCEVKELIINDCPQIERLNVESNSLTNLDFIKELTRLQKLNVDNNPELAFGLELLPKGIKFSSDNTKLNYQEEKNEELAKLQKENEDLKESKKNLKKAIQENVVDQLDQLDSKLGKITKKIERSGSFSQAGNTDELTAIAGQVVKNIKGINENLKNELSEVKIEIQSLEKKLTNAQEELEDKQTVLKALKQDLKNSPSDNEIQKKVNSYEQKIEDLREKENKLQIELAKLSGKIESKDEELIHLRKQAERPTYQTNISKSSGVNAITGDSNILSNQIIYQIQINPQQLQTELANVKQNYQNLEQANNSGSLNSQQLKKSLLFLASKQILANKRQETINSLIETYNNLTKSTKKYEKINLVANYLSYGEELVGAVPFGSTAVKVFSKGLPVIANLLKSNSLKQQANKFEEYLIEDEKALTLLQATYQSLNNSLAEPSKISSLISNLIKSSNSELVKHNVFAVAKLEKSSSLKEADMIKAIELLTNHLKDFNQSLQLETKTCLEQLEIILASEHGQQLQQEVEQLLNKLIGKEEQEITSDSQEIVLLAQQITAKNSQLQTLINSTKDKLKSNHLLSANKKTQQRNELFDQFLATGFIDSKLVSVVKEKNINLAEITNLQNSIKNLQEQLDDLQLENKVVQLGVSKF